MRFRACQFEYSFPRPALVMGIVNVTPDSFSDGGHFFDTGSAVEHAIKLVDQGAEILDIGGESTRPDSKPVDEAEELRRVVPVIEALAARVGVPISIDTMKLGVARAALKAGASIVNDVASNREDEAMWRLVGETGAGYICVHMQGTPQTMQINPQYRDVVREVEAFFKDRIQRLNGCGVGLDQVMIDPGIGFGKRLEHNLELLRALGHFSQSECPVLLGVSRKSFLGKVSGAETGSRLSAALACACLAVEAGVSVLRVHDVPETVQAIRMTEAILGR